MTDDDKALELARKQLAADNRHSTLTQEQTEAMLADSYQRRSKRDRAREALRKELGRVPMDEKVKQVKR